MTQNSLVTNITEEMMDFIPISQPNISEREIAYVTDAVTSGWVSSLGEYIEKFERLFAEFCGTEFALTTSNGTTALHLALAARGVGEGDEVIIPDITFVATANAVSYTNAKPVIVDIEGDSLCIDPQAIRDAITPRTKAIIPVHLYGHPANMIEINKMASEHDLFVLEDAAEAHGAEEQGKRVGGLGHAATFSFYGNKIITCGEGGMVTTNDPDLYAKMKYLRDHAMSKEKRYWHTEIGFNYRMTNLQAALGLAQLERMDEILVERKQIFDWYHDRLKDVEGLKLNRQRDGYQNVYWLICAEMDGFDYERRDEFMRQLRSVNIDSRPYFYPMSSLPMYDTIHKNECALQIAQTGLNLPTFTGITESQVDYICTQIRQLLS